jgi:hypothetical protein
MMGNEEESLGNRALFDVLSLDLRNWYNLHIIYKVVIVCISIRGLHW